MSLLPAEFIKNSYIQVRTHLFSLKNVVKNLEMILIL